MKKLIYLLFCLLILACSKTETQSTCEDVALANPSTTMVNEQDYKIYEAIRTKFYHDTDFLHINQKIAKKVEFGYLLDEEWLEGFGLDSLLVINYIEKNQEDFFLEPVFEAPFHLIHPDEEACFFDLGGNGWAKYYNKYETSSGIIQWHRPGYNEIGTNAFLEYSELCGYLCGYGFIVFLEKVNDEWIVIERHLVWIS